MMPDVKFAANSPAGTYKYEEFLQLNGGKVRILLRQAYSVQAINQGGLMTGSKAQRSLCTGGYQRRYDRRFSRSTNASWLSVLSRNCGMPAANDKSSPSELLSQERFALFLALIVSTGVPPSKHRGEASLLCYLVMSSKTQDYCSYAM